MANHICQKPLATLGENRLDDDVAPAELSLTLASAFPSGGPDGEPLDGCVLEAVMSRAECERMVASAEAGGFSFWDADGRSERSESMRSADTVEFEDAALCAALWERLRPHVPEWVEVSEEQPRY